jgi:Ca2+-binding RTX toxin-like protein
VTLDDAANDGTPGELDNVKSDIERVSGGNGNDSLDASAATNGPKSLSGGLGDDTIVGSPVSSLLAGGDGNDTITGGAGVDLIYGDSGIDSINSRDRGRDRVDCGLGVDNPVQGDVGDQLTGCEGTAVLTPLAPPKPTLGGPRKIKASTFAKKRTVSVTALPSGPARLDGELWAAGRLAKAGQLSRGSAKPGQLSLGTARLGLAAGKRTLKIKVSKSNAKAIVKKARSRALRKKGYRVTVTVTATDAAGLSGTATRTIRITR